MHARRRAQLTGTNRPIGLIRSSDGKGIGFAQAQAETRPQRAPGGGHAPQVVRLTWTRGVLVVCQDNEAHAMFSHGGSRSGLVAISAATHPIPSRTRPLSAALPMVLRPKTRESRSPPDLIGTPPRSQPHDPDAGPAPPMSWDGGRQPRPRAPQGPSPATPGRAGPPGGALTTWRGVEQPGSSSGS